MIQQCIDKDYIN